MFMQILGSVGSLGGSQLGGMIKGLGKALSAIGAKKAGEKVTKAAEKISKCDSAIFGLGLGVATTSFSLNTAIKAFDSTTKTAKTYSEDLEKKVDLGPAATSTDTNTGT